MQRRPEQGRSRILAATALLASASALALWLGAGDDPARGPDPAVASRPAGGPADPRPVDPVQQPEPEPGSPPEPQRLPLPASPDVVEFLRNKPVVGSLEVDAHGHFRPTRDARALFDHFFLAHGLASEEQMLDWIQTEIRARLEPPAEAEALDVLERYAELRGLVRAVASWEESLERRLQRLADLRRSALGPDLAEVFFGEEERRTRVDLEIRALRADARLSAEERAQRIAEAEEKLPADVLRGRRATTAPGRVQAQVERMRAEGAAETEIFALREREFGRPAAERLAALDRERQQRQQAWARYRPLRDALVAGTPAGGSELDAQLEALRRRFFPGAELDAVRTRDRIEMETGIVLPP